MDIEKIKELVKTLEDSSLNELFLEEDGMKIKLKKRPEGPAMQGFVPPMPPAFYPPGPGFSAGPESSAADAKDSKAEETDEYIVSPIVGVFYSAPAPDAPAYVRVGDKVRKGETVCILEAMKLMNEIQTDFDCEIEAVLVSNEQKVEYGQPLFRVKKLS